MSAETGKYLLQGGTLADGSSRDLLIENGVISSVSAGINAPDATVIDATGMIVMAGLVDLHTHLREPGREDSETVLSGSRAGVKGGSLCNGKYITGC